MNTRILSSLAILVAAGSLVAPLAFWNKPQMSATFHASYFLGALFVCSSIVLVSREKWRAWWLLLICPIALLWPAVDLWLEWTCQTMHDCL